MEARLQRPLPGLLLGAVMVLATSEAQLPIERERDFSTLNGQVEDLFVSLRAPVQEAARSTVEVRVWRHRVAYGTVVGKERVLSKWSEVARDLRSLSCRTRDGQWLSAKVLGVYRAEDLALLEVPGLEAPPIDLSPGKPLQLGSFLAMARPDGEVASMGVASVLPRSLRAADQGFLGIQMDMTFPGPGVLVLVREKGSAADRVGLLPDDVILKINDLEVNGGFELKSALQNLQPGERIKLTYRRGEEVMTRETKLDARRNPPRISEERMERMNNLGGIHRFSKVKSGFRNILQSDMPLQPEDCGAPVVDLDGTFVGLTVARAARIKSYILPTVELVGLLERDPAELTPRDLTKRESPETRRLRELLRERGHKGSPEEIRRHLEEMRRLMEEVEEMEP